ncbi:flagellar motor protein MotD [Methylocaldum szegediense]|uniref:Chemotaxis protein MotB n=1 Tax=Methylocaldum szegediense TaxID=73780 RepID=A0ABN8X843_9GAMM|nr:flagellar motor protein MotD [Methylocaldum szegediense]CAI8931904.1 chemotaxis protein MotB [Methylocaldum szegediense]
MARRRHSEEEHVNLERWLVSYADFITLLFAFFVVMYAISSVNEGKYRVLSESLSEVFKEPRKDHDLAATLEPIQIGHLKKGQDLLGEPVTQEDSKSFESKVDAATEDLETEYARLEHLADQIEAALSPFIDDDLVVVKRHELWVEVEMKSGLFFASGKADLSKESLPILDRLSEILREVDNTIHVEGHTDSVPINTSQYPSNWALSSARAAVVVHQLMRNGIDPRRMAAIGYGEYHPVADNGTDEGRYQNRRVVIVLMSHAAARYKLSSADQVSDLDAPQKPVSGTSPIVSTEVAKP